MSCKNRENDARATNSTNLKTLLLLENTSLLPREAAGQYARMCH